MKPIYRMLWVCTLMMVVFSSSTLYAQAGSDTFTTSGGLSATHPASWEAYENSPLTLVLENEEGWSITISAGTAAIYNFDNLDADASADVVLAGFIDFMKLTEAVIDQEIPDRVQVGNLPALKQTAVTHTGVPFEAVAFNLPDGTVILSFVGKEGDTIPPTPEILDIFYGVLASVTFTEVSSDDHGTDSPATDEVYIPDGAVVLADLEPGVLRFEQGIETTYPEGWSIYSEYPYIESYAALFYGESFMSFKAFTAITVQDQADLPLETFRDSIMPTTAMLYTGREDYDAERDLVSETLADGRVIEYLDVSDAETLMGNTFIIPLDARYWAWATLTIVPTQTDPELRAEEVLEMVKNLSFVQQEGAFMIEGYQLIVQDATCDLKLSTNHVNESAPYALFACPANCAEAGYEVWGSEIYTLDSNLCAAAIHAGAISDEGGTVLTTWLPGQESYTATEQNGISTMEYDAWWDSFKVEPFTTETE